MAESFPFSPDAPPADGVNQPAVGPPFEAWLRQAENQPAPRRRHRLRAVFGLVVAVAVVLGTVFAARFVQRQNPWFVRGQVIRAIHLPAGFTYRGIYNAGTHTLPPKSPQAYGMWGTNLPPDQACAEVLATLRKVPGAVHSVTGGIESELQRRIEWTRQAGRFFR